MTQPASREEAFQVACSAARKAGQLMMEMRRDNTVSVERKSAIELITSADTAAERIIISEIQAAFPEHSLLSEEACPTINDPTVLQGPLWIIDPIDGTTNYSRGFDHTAVSIAYAVEGKVELGVVHAPFLKETYTALRGQGALCNEQPIAVSKTRDLRDAIVAVGRPYNKQELDALARQISPLFEQCLDVRRLGAAAVDICWVACGKLDCFYESLSPWDIAAGGLIAREAGAVTGHLTPYPEDAVLPPDLHPDEFIVATSALYQELRSLLTDVG